MVEPEMAYATLADLQQLAQGLIQSCIRHALEHHATDLALFEAHGGRTLSQWEAWAHEPFETLTYTQAIDLLQSQSPFGTSVSWGMDLQSDHEKWITSHVGKMLILTHYPKALKAFYMRQSLEGQTVEAMDVLAPGLGELIGGSVREERHAVLLQRLAERSMDPMDYSAYLDLRRFGTVPHGGFGLGFERLLMFLASLSSIKEAIPYPRHA